MKLKNQFLSLSALLAMGMATTSAWAANTEETYEVKLQGDAISGYYVNLPNPSENPETKITATLTIPENVKSFKVYDNGGATGSSSPYPCTNNRNCSVRLVVTPQTGDFLHLSGSVTGDNIRFIVDPGTTRINLSDKHSIYVETTSSDLMAWTYNQSMQIEFWEKVSAGGKNIDLTIDVAMDIGTGGPGEYSFTDGVDYLEMHASNTTSQVNKTTTLTSPVGTMMYVAFDDLLADGDTVAVLNGESNSTDTLFKKTNATNNDVVYIPSNVATICVNTNDNGLNNILRVYARVLTKNTAQSTDGIDLYTNEAGYAVAQISDIENGSISIPTEVEVNVIEYDRVFTAGTPATIVLPFQLPEGATTNGKFYYLKEVVKIDNNCKWKAIFRNIKLKEPNPNALPAANTPYAVIVEDGSELTFNLNGGKAKFQTATIAEQEDESGKWIFKGTYEYKTWNSNDEEIGLAYALASENSANYTAGQYVRVGAGAYAYPMRAYVRKVNADVRLSRPLAKGEVSSIEDMPEVIDVEFVDEGEKPMAIGRMNTVTGAIKINRWIDLKGRSTNHKPTTKGVFFNKKGIAK